MNETVLKLDGYDVVCLGRELPIEESIPNNSPNKVFSYLIDKNAKLSLEGFLGVFDFQGVVIQLKMALKMHVRWAIL